MTFDQVTVTAICGAIVAVSTLGNNVLTAVIASRQSRNAAAQASMHVENKAAIAEVKDAIAEAHKP